MRHPRFAMSQAATGESIPPESSASTRPDVPTGSPPGPLSFSLNRWMTFSRMSRWNVTSGRMRFTLSHGLVLALQPQLSIMDQDQSGWRWRWSDHRITAPSAGDVRLMQHAKLVSLKDLLGHVVIFHAQGEKRFSVRMRNERIEVINVDLGFEQGREEAV